MKTAAIAAISTTRPIESVFHDHLAQCVLELFSEASVAIDGSKFKAVNTRDRNFTQAKMQRRLAQIDESIARYLSQLDSADRQGEAVPEAKITRLNEKIATLRESVVGQTQKSECATGKSALPSRTDVASRACQVRKVPISDIPARKRFEWM